MCDSLKNLAAALIKAQLDMDPLHKDAKNPHLNSKYATLAGVQEVALPALGKYEIAVMQSVSTDWNESGALVRVGCTLIHAPSGESVVNEIALRPTKSDPQGIGSAITYGRRYLLMAMAGLAPEDDDGNEASGKQAKQPQAQPQRPNASPTPSHRQPEATQTPASNGNVPTGNGDFAQIVGKFKTPQDAWKWAADGKHTENEHSAQTRWTAIVKEKGGYTPAKFNEIAAAYVAHYMSKKEAA